MLLYISVVLSFTKYMRLLQKDLYFEYFFKFGRTFIKKNNEIGGIIKFAVKS